jgi:uncharacterized protein
LLGEIDGYRDKKIFQRYLRQLETIVTKTPPEVFPLTLCDDMLSLEDNAKIASDFALRGYCPLLDIDLVSLFSEESGKAVVQKQLSDTLAYLNDLPDITQLFDEKTIKEKAGVTEVEFTQSVFIHQYMA